tara:strand:+ start:248 stop:466 length:219 start_codon:yes stop_codon:yes gene_type:complete
MGNRASQKVERIVYRLEQRKATRIAQGQPVLRKEFQPRNETTRTPQTICHERSGDAGARKACVEVVLGIYLY